jgi:phage terminase large subunit-like protein
LKDLTQDPATVTTRSRTLDNAANLAPGFLKQVLRRYGNTALGRQELEGEIMDQLDSGLWRREQISAQRITAPPDLTRIVVAVDPPVTSNANSDACGIVVAGLGADGRGYVLADRTIRGREPIVCRHPRTEFAMCRHGPRCARRRWLARASEATRARGCAARRLRSTTRPVSAARGRAPPRCAGAR